ncbi:unnamed protein product, partial [Ostreobium quekettii]
MGGFTRILHSGRPDDLMDEIPTYVAKPLPNEAENRGYVVLNRPYAFLQWARDTNIAEKYVLMSEPDHLFLRPLPNLMKGEHPAAFPFFYIDPAKKEFANITRKFTGQLPQKDLEDIFPMGNAPTMMTFLDLKSVTNKWLNVSLAIFKDDEAQKEWGWVQEMYGFTIASYLVGIRNVSAHLNLMAQPPWDTQLSLTRSRPYYILHYTYGMDYTLEGVFTPGVVGKWRFDKRSYAARPPARHLGEPPPGMSNRLVRLMIDMFNT